MSEEPKKLPPGLRQILVEYTTDGPKVTVTLGQGRGKPQTTLVSLPTEEATTAWAEAVLVGFLRANGIEMAPPPPARAPAPQRAPQGAETGRQRKPLPTADDEPRLNADPGPIMAELHDALAPLGVPFEIVPQSNGVRLELKVAKDKVSGGVLSFDAYVEDGGVGPFVDHILSKVGDGS